MSVTEQPFVVEPPGDQTTARQVAEQAAAQWGLPRPVALRTGMSALFLAGEVVLRVCRPTAAPEQAVWLTDQLATRGVRTARLVRREAFVTDGLAVYALERLHPLGQVDWRAVGATVRRVHDWPVDEVRGRYPLPRCDDFIWWNAEAGLAEVDDLLDAEARAGLHAAVAARGGWRSLITDRVVCHGDVHPGNVVPTADGPVLVDWDLLCHGPAAWDHAVVLTWERRWGADRGMYAAFAEGYGTSLAGDPLTESLAVMRNVIATIMRLKAGRTSAAAAAEAERRLQFWRGDPDAPHWQAM